MTRRLVVVAPGTPHPTHGASRVLFWHYLVGLRDAGFELRVVLLLEPGNHNTEDLTLLEAELVEPGRVEVVTVSSDGFLVRGRTGARLRRSEADRARATIGDSAHDAIVCFDFLAAQVVAPLPGPKVVWLGDLNFQTEWHHARYRAKEHKAGIVRLPAAGARSMRSMLDYRKVLGGFDAIGTASKSSEDVLGRLGLRARYVAYPWPEPTSDTARRWQEPDRPTFLFFGTLFALGSRSGFHFLLDELYPRLRAHWPDFRILIAGHGQPPPWAQPILDAAPEIEMLGFVDDLGDLFARVHAVLVPIDVPVGNRSRIATAMAHRCLVIAHQNAALGNPDLVDGRTCYLASGPATFADAMVKAVEDRSAATDIIAAARASYERWFEPTVAVRALVQLTDDAVATPRRGRAGGDAT